MPLLVKGRERDYKVSLWNGLFHGKLITPVDEDDQGRHYHERHHHHGGRYHDEYHDDDYDVDFDYHCPSHRCREDYVPHEATSRQYHQSYGYQHNNIPSRPELYPTKDYDGDRYYDEYYDDDYGDDLNCHCQSHIDREYYVPHDATSRQDHQSYGYQQDNISFRPEQYPTEDYVPGYQSASDQQNETWAPQQYSSSSYASDHQSPYQRDDGRAISGWYAPPIYQGHQSQQHEQDQTSTPRPTYTSGHQTVNQRSHPTSFSNRYTSSAYPSYTQQSEPSSPPSPPASLWQTYDRRPSQDPTVQRPRRSRDSQVITESDGNDSKYDAMPARARSKLIVPRAMDQPCIQPQTGASRANGLRSTISGTSNALPPAPTSALSVSRASSHPTARTSAPTARAATPTARASAPTARTSAPTASTPATRNSTIANAVSNVQPVARVDPVWIGSSRGSHSNTILARPVSAREPWSGEEFEYARRRAQQEKYMAALRQTYPIGDDKYYRIQPDQHFAVLDCGLLALLEKKHEGEKWVDIQIAFYTATGCMVAVKALQDLSSSTSQSRNVNFFQRDYVTLQYVTRKCRDEKLQGVQRDFFQGTQRMIGLDVLREKLKWA